MEIALKRMRSYWQPVIRQEIFFSYCIQKKYLIESKPFALGVRVEHPQALIDSLQYHRDTRDRFLATRFI